MRGSSLASLQAVQAEFERALAAVGESAVGLGAELFAVTDALDDSGSLRRALTDPSRDGKDKEQLVRDVLAAGFNPQTVTVVVAAARARWSHAKDLADAVEIFGVHAILADAEHAGLLEQVGNELFLASRALIGAPAIREALMDPRSDKNSREALLTTLFQGKVDPRTLTLMRRAAGTPRGVHVVPALQRFSDLAAERRNRQVAHVTARTQLTAVQLERIGDLLQRAYGQKIQVDLSVDPDVLGGLRIQIGPDVVDSTVLSRLAEVRRRIAS